MLGRGETKSSEAEVKQTGQMISTLKATLISTLESGLKTVGDPYFWLTSRTELLSLFERCPVKSGKDLLQITKTYRGCGWYKCLEAAQVDDELIALCDWAIRQKPRRIMEIGTAFGGTLLAWCRIASELVVSVDLPGGIHGGGYAGRRKRLYRLFTKGHSTPTLHLVRQDSQKPATRQLVEDILGPSKFDILLIDGDHRFEGVEKDYTLWRGMVQPGGFIVFHDILRHKRSRDCQVDVLWNQIKQEYPHHEIIADPEQGWAGIGIVQLASDGPTPK